MNTGLVVIGDTDRHRSLLETASDAAVGADAELVVLSTVSDEEFELNREAVAQVGNNHGAVYGLDTAEQTARTAASDLIRDTLADVDLEYRIVPRVLDSRDVAEQVLEVAEEHGCDHIFLVGQHRSPTGKAIFGDTAQSVILGFDGQVTVDLE